ncbi:MAG: aldolase/citrate lyase family protein [Chloroflexi bacterium]|nr:aldolase/citrate lyase family protein [Chloroflexota bacterium]
MNKNTLKQKLNAGNTAIGPFVGLPSPGMVETMGWMGFDFVVIDCEHGPMDYETAENMIRAAELSGTTPILRIGLNEQQHIQRYLEAGAAGVMIPLINDAEDAQKVVDSVKYPPIGRRGAFSGRSARFGLQAMAEYIKEANEETFISLQIETPEGVENQDEIIATEYADAIFLGPGDLSVNFGLPGQTMHEKVVDTIEGLVTRIHDAGKHAGTLGVTAEQTIFWHGRGVRWIVNSAPKFLQAGAADYLAAVKGPLGL